MTPEEIAELAGCAREYVLCARRLGDAIAAKVNGKWSFCPVSVIFIAARKDANLKKLKQVGNYRAGNAAWKSADAPRHFCVKHDRPCTLIDIGAKCHTCPRDRRYEDVASVISDTFEDVIAMYKEAVR